MSDPTTPQRHQLERIAQGDNTLLMALERLFERVGTEMDGMEAVSVLGAAVSAGQASAARSMAQAVEVLSAVQVSRKKVEGGLSMPPRPENPAKDYIDFRIAPTTASERRLCWGDDTLTAGLLNDVTMQIGKDVLVYGLNNSGVAISKGQSIMATGASAGAVTIARAVSNGTVSAAKMLGIAAQDIADGEGGYTTVSGVVEFDTTGLTAGAVAYFDPSTSGGLTSTAPAAPNLRAPRAFTLSAGASGAVQALPASEARVSGLQDVDVTGLADGDLLTWDDTAGTWVVLTVHDLAGDIDLSDLGDVSALGATSGQHLSFNGTDWVPVTPAAAPSGATGSFTAGSGEAITVTNGLISSIV